MFAATCLLSKKANEPLFSIDDVPKQCLFDNYISAGSDSRTAHNISISTEITRLQKSLSHNEKFRKALNQICDALAEGNEVDEFKHKLDMFKRYFECFSTRFILGERLTQLKL